MRTPGTPLLLLAALLAGGWIALAGGRACPSPSGRTLLVDGIELVEYRPLRVYEAGGAPRLAERLPVAQRLGTPAPAPVTEFPVGFWTSASLVTNDQLALVHPEQFGAGLPLLGSAAARPPHQHFGPTAAKRLAEWIARRAPVALAPATSDEVLAIESAIGRSTDFSVIRLYFRAR